MTKLFTGPFVVPPRLSPGISDQVTSRAVRSLEDAVESVISRMAKAAVTTGSTSPLFNILDYGAVADGKTDSTGAIQAALDAAAASHGVALVPSTAMPFMFSNLKMGAYSKLRGDHMYQSKLFRLPGSTGTALREKTAAEGNTFGATGIWVSDLYIDGQSTAGDGVDLGRQTGYGFTSYGSVQNLLVAGFTSGTGIIIASNAQSFAYLWASGCQIGLDFHGGVANTVHSLWSEENTSYQLVVSDVYSNFFGLQFEDGSSSPSLRVTGSQNNFSGIYSALQANKALVIDNAGGANRNAYRDISVSDNGHSYTDTIKHAGPGVGSGALPSVREFIIGESSGDASFYVNGSTGWSNKLAGDVFKIGGGMATRTKNGTPSDADFSNPQDGLIVIDTSANKLWARTGGVWKSCALI